MSDSIIYLDNAATTKVDQRVLEYMLPYFSRHYGNSASRFHAYGWEAEELVDNAKKGLADKLSLSEKDIIFTSGATESINLALKGNFDGNNGHLITVETEHKATLDTAEYLEKRGIELTLLGVDQDGNIDLDELEKGIRNNTKLISIMHANNETGVLHPINEVITMAHKHGVKVHVDASQSLGKVEFPSDADFLSFSAHKVYGPKGMGVLISKQSNDLKAQIHGGKHQRNRRSGTLNIPGIAGTLKAIEILDPKENARLENLRNSFEKELKSNLKNIRINGERANRIGNISNITFEGLDGEELLMRMNKIAVSNGSACNTASTEPSYVLRAMGLSSDDAYSSIRFSLGRFTTKEDIENAKDHVIDIINNHFIG